MQWGTDSNRDGQDFTGFFGVWIPVFTGMTVSKPPGMTVSKSPGMTVSKSQGIGDRPGRPFPLLDTPSGQC